MLSKLAKLFVFTTILFYLFHFLFFGLFETTDSFFFWAFADFLRTGKYSTPHPYYWTIPSTLEPPLYSIFLYLAQFAKKGEIIIHLFHILALFLTAYFIYKIIKHFIRKELALIIVSVFILLPVNILQTSSLMSETFSLLFVAVYMFLSYKILTKREVYIAKYLLLLSSIGVLLRYNFIGFFGLMLVQFVQTRFVLARQTRFVLSITPRGWPRFNRGTPPMVKESEIDKWQDPQIKINIIHELKLDLLFVFLSFSIIAGWILINHQLNDSWGLSDSQGKNLYNRIIGGDKLLPSENDPNWQKLRQLAGSDVDLLQPVYNIEPYILPKLGMNVTRESQLFGAIALSALKEHPWQYFQNTLINGVRIHGNGLVVPNKVYTDSPWMGKNCRTLGNITFCQGVVNSRLGSLVWNKIVDLGEWYSFHFPVLFNWLFLAPSLIFAFIKKNKFIKFCAFSYLTAVLITVIPEVPVYRYLYPLYPLKIILITYFLLNIFNIIKHYKTNIQNGIVMRLQSSS